MFIDTHAHLDFERFDEDRELVIERAKKAGVERIINISCDLSTARRGLVLAEQHEGIYATCGCHPAELKIRGKDSFETLAPKNKTDQNYVPIDELRQLIIDSKKIVAVGEIGLDYYWMKAPVKVQQQAFREQLKLAKEFDLPVVVHCRAASTKVSASGLTVDLPTSNAYEDCFTILLEENITKAVFHCFAGSLEFARRAWEAGYLTSFTGIITYPNATTGREVVRACPLDHCMIETDCPFLAPQKYRGQRNEPAYVVEVAREVAVIKVIDLEELTLSLKKTTEQFFAIK